MPARDLIMAACGLALLGAGHAKVSERDAVTVLAAVAQTRPLSIANPLDSRFQPDGLPVVVPEPRTFDI